MSERAFSVVICTDGRLRFVKAAIRALRALDYRNFEVIVVCGPTPDGTSAWLDALPDIKRADCPARNLSRARNIGLALATGEIVAFLDDDAIPEPEWLGDLNAAYDSPGVAAAGGIVYDRSGLTLQSAYVTLDRLGYGRSLWRAPAPHLNYPFSPEFPHLLGANCSFRRDMLVKLGGFDEEYEFFLDESDLIARVNDAGGRIAQCAGAAVHHKYAASASRSANKIVREWKPLLKNRLYFALRNGARHHNPLEALQAALNDAEAWRRAIEDSVARGDLEATDLQRFLEEAQSAFVEGIAAARKPRRLLAPGAAPPPFRPFPTLAPPDRLCIALVTQDYPPGHNGGIARNTAELAREWAALGHDVHVFTRPRGEPPSLDFEDGVWVHRADVHEGPPPPDLIAPHAIPQALWDHSRTMFDEAARLDARRRVDFVYAPLWDCEPAAFLAEPRFPLVCALQTTMDFWLDSNPGKRVDIKWMAERGAPLLALERWILARAPILHANSRAIVDDIERRYAIALSPARVAHAPHGVSDGSDIAPPGAGVRFLFVGRLESRKGIDTLLAAAPEVLRRFPDSRLDLVGDASIDGGKYKAGFPAHARVAFHGRVGEAALRGHYQACDVVLAPSRYESFGLVYIEAMSFARPVIGGRAGGGAEVIEDGVTGLLIDPGDVADLTQAMIALASDADLRRAMGAAGRRRYEARFTAEKAAAALLGAVRERLSAS